MTTSLGILGLVWLATLLARWLVAPPKPRPSQPMRPAAPRPATSDGDPASGWLLGHQLATHGTAATGWPLATRCPTTTSGPRRTWRSGAGSATMTMTDRAAADVDVVVDDAGHGFMLASDPDGLQVWSTVRLPFEPRGWLVDLRAALRGGLSRLGGAGILHAQYTSGVRGLADAENVLLYNVGMSAVSHLTRAGVAVERSYHEPPPAPAAWTGQPLLHHHRYTMVPAEQAFRSWVEGPVFAAFDRVPIDAANVAGVFTGLRRGAMAPSDCVAAGEPFGLTLSLDVPPARARSLHQLVKVVVDGVVASMHVHDGTALGEVTARLAGKGHGTGAELTAMLGDARWAALGARTLVRPFRSGVIWNPADDLCVAAKVLIRPGTSPQVRLSGQMFPMRTTTTERRGLEDLRTVPGGGPSRLFGVGLPYAVHGSGERARRAGLSRAGRPMGDAVVDD